MEYSRPYCTPYGGKGPLVLGITWTEALVALILVTARLFGARVRSGELRWDFAWVAVAAILGMGAQSMLTVATANGIGQHVWELDIPYIAKALKFFWVSASIGLFAIAFAKIAIVALFLGIQGPSQYKRRMFLHFLWISNLVFSIVLVVFIFTQCTPVAKIWDITIIQGNCNLRRGALKFGYFQGAWAALTDMILAVFPIFIAWDLQTSVRMKVGFCVLMSGGFVAAIGGILRTYYIRTLTFELDATWDFADFMIWAGTELWFIIILGSIPPLRPLFVKYVQPGKLLSSLGSKRSRSGNGKDGSDGSGSGNNQSSSAQGSGGSAPSVTDEKRLLNHLGGTPATGEDREDGEDMHLKSKDGIVVQSTFEMVETEGRDWGGDVEKDKDEKSGRRTSQADLV